MREQEKQQYQIATHSYKDRDDWWLKEGLGTNNVNRIVYKLYVYSTCIGNYETRLIKLSSEIIKKKMK